MTEVATAVARASRAGTVLGLAVVILGVLSIAAPVVPGLAVAMLVAILMIAAGIARLAWSFRAGSFGKGVLTFLLGGVMVLCGLVMLGRPLLNLASLTLVLVAYFLVDGVTDIVASVTAKPAQGWGWLLFDGIVTMLLAIFVWRQWPMSGTWAIGVLVGVRLLFAGFSMMALGGLGSAVARRAGAAGV